MPLISQARPSRTCNPYDSPDCIGSPEQVTSKHKGLPKQKRQDCHDRTLCLSTIGRWIDHKVLLNNPPTGLVHQQWVSGTTALTSEHGSDAADTEVTITTQRCTKADKPRQKTNDGGDRAAGGGQNRAHHVLNTKTRQEALATETKQRTCTPTTLPGKLGKQKKRTPMTRSTALAVQYGCEENKKACQIINRQACH